MRLRPPAGGLVPLRASRTQYRQQQERKRKVSQYIRMPALARPLWAQHKPLTPARGDPRGEMLVSISTINTASYSCTVLYKRREIQVRSEDATLLDVCEWQYTTYS